jgi:hypothetical protein
MSGIAFHSITLSARTRIVGGTVTPSDLGRFHVDHEFEFRRSFDGQVTGLGAFQYFVHEYRRATP